MFSFLSFWSWWVFDDDDEDDEFDDEGDQLVGLRLDLLAGCGRTLAWASSLVHLAHCYDVFLSSLDVEIYVDDSLVRPPTWSTWRRGQSNSLQHVFFIVMIVIPPVY